MFKESCKNNREAIYGVHGFSQISDTQIKGQLGSGFTIAPGILVTVAHLVHLDANPKNPRVTHFEVIRSPDIGQKMESASLIAEDLIHDIALLKITSPRSTKFLTLEPDKVPTGTSCGSLGFPLGELVQTPNGRSINLTERFQGSYVSSFCQAFSPSGHIVDCYEIDSLMYNGSSGCPGFLVNGHVIGMQSQSRLGQGAAKPLLNAETKTLESPNIQLAISMWVPSMDIIKFAKENGITL